MRTSVLLISSAIILPASIASAQNYEYRSGWYCAVAQIGVTSSLHDTITGAGFGVAILDGQAAASHPDISGKISTFILYSGTYNGADGHGTHVSGTAAGTRNSIGIVGVAPGAHIYNYPVFDTRGWVASDLARSALEHIKGQNGAGAKIRSVNMSYGPSARGDLFLTGELNIFDDYKDEFVIVRAAGNSGMKIGYESYASQASVNLSHLLVVGSVNANNTISNFSNRPGTNCIGPTRSCAPSERIANFFIVAPGERIASSYPGGWAYMSGTSMASPHVTGAVALVAQDALIKNVALAPSDIAGILKRSATDLGVPGVDGIYGWGLLNVPAALAPVGGTTVTTGTTVDSGTTTTTEKTRRPRRRNRNASYDNNDDNNSDDNDDILTGMVVFDDYDRPFEIGAGAFEAPRRAQFGDRLDDLPTISASHVIAEGAGEGFAFAAWSTSSDTFAPASSFRFVGETFSMRTAVGAPQVSFGLAQGRLDNVAEAQELDAMMFGALGEATHLFDRTASALFRANVAEGWSVTSFAMSSFSPSASDLEESLLQWNDGYEASLAGFALERRFAPSAAVGISYGAIREHGTVIGDEFEGALAFGETTLTQTVGLTFAAKLSERIALDGFYSVAFIDAYGAHNSIFREPEGWTGNQFGVTATSAGLFGRADALRVSLIKPLRVTDGTIVARVPVGRELDGTVRYDLRTRPYADGSTPGNLRLEYLAPVGAVRTGVALDVIDDDVFLRNPLRYGISFSVSTVF
jgi:hypothetical protein